MKMMRPRLVAASRRSGVSPRRAGKRYRIARENAAAPAHRRRGKRSSPWPAAAPEGRRDGPRQCKKADLARPEPQPIGKGSFAGSYAGPVPQRGDALPELVGRQRHRLFHDERMCRWWGAGLNLLAARRSGWGSRRRRSRRWGSGWRCCSCSGSSTSRSSPRRWARRHCRAARRPPGLLAALAVGGWVFIGFDACVGASEETRNAARHVPRAIWIALLSVGGIVIRTRSR